jgi:diaminobutyrate-2-oxoglutarate transaminase
MAQGLKFDDESSAAAVCRRSFEHGLLMETSGPRDEVVKLLPALTTSIEDLDTGLDVLAESLATVASS